MGIGVDVLAEPSRSLSGDDSGFTVISDEESASGVELLLAVIPIPEGVDVVDWEDGRGASGLDE
jgi:hypothetical protein